MVKLSLLSKCKKIKTFFKSVNNIGYEKKYAKRTSKLNPLNLIETVIMTLCHNKKSSLNAYTMNYNLLTGKNISRQAIDQRINENTVEFEKGIFEQAMGLLSDKISIKPRLIKHFNNLHVIDSTIIDLSPQLKDSFKGYGGSSNKLKTSSALKMHVVYDPISKKVNHIGITEAVSTDKGYITEVSYFEKLKTNDLVIFDLSYFSTDVLKTVSERPCMTVATI